VDPLPAEVGSTVELSDVLLIAGNGDVRVGQPRLEGARVIAEVMEHGRGPKVIVFKYKPKTRYHRRRGHRQGYTRLAVRQILTMEEPVEGEEKPKRRRAAKAEVEAEEKPARRARARKPKPEPEATETAAEVVEAPEAEEKPARRTRARKPKAEPEAAAAEVVEAPEAEEKPARRTRARKPKPEQSETATEAKPTRRTRARKPKAEDTAGKTGDETPKSGE
jgi:large subunit ribosomal protein L21